MTPPFEIKPFEKMTKKEAQLHFNWYLSDIPKRIELIKSAYLETTGENSDDLDLSPQSLVKLWTWFIPRIETVIKSEDEIEAELKDLPEWMRDEITEDKKTLSVGTLCLAMDIAIYFGETFIKNFNNLDWGFVTKPKSLVYVNSPVIIGFSSGIDLDPRNLIYILTLKVIDGNKNKKELLNLFNIWKDDI